MDEELNRRWREGRAPFNGVTVHLEQHIPLSDLRAALLVVVDTLKEQWPDATLDRMEDWHEHHGVPSRPEETTWSEIERTLASDDSLYAARTGDTYVHIGLCPSSREFYLRFYPMDEDTPDAGWPKERVGRYGSFDLTCDQRLAEMVMERLLPLQLPGLSTCPAKGYFDARYDRLKTYFPGDPMPAAVRDMLIAARRHHARRRWWRAPKLLLGIAIFGILWGLAALLSVAEGRRMLNISPCFAGTPSGNKAMFVLAVLSLVQARAILVQNQRGVYAVWAWCASFPVAHWFMSPPEVRTRLTAFGIVFALAVGVYTWHNRWWFAGGVEPKRRRWLSLRVWPGSFAIFRDVLPAKFRDLPPMFYQLIAAGTAFGFLAIVASFTVLPMLASDFPSPLTRLSLVIAPLFGILGITQAIALLLRARWAVWAVYGWFMSILLAAWVFLPARADGRPWAATLLPPLLVTAGVALCARSLYKRRHFLRGRD
jgi:hypothetical protein